MNERILSNEDFRKIKILKMREKFKKADKSGKDLDLKDFGMEIIDPRYVEPEEADEIEEEEEEADDEMGESEQSAEEQKEQIEEEIDWMSIHSSELNSENLEDSDDEKNPHGFLISSNLDTFWKSKRERLAESYVSWEEKQAE